MIFCRAAFYTLLFLHVFATPIQAAGILDILAALRSSNSPCLRAMFTIADAGMALPWSLGNSRKPRVHAPEVLDGAHGISQARMGNIMNELNKINAALGTNNIVFGNVEPHYNPGKTRILDVGGATGEIGFALAKRANEKGKDVQVTVLDIDPALVELANKRKDQLPPGAFQAVVGDATKLDKSTTYEIVTMTQTLHHFSDPKKMKEIILGMTRASSNKVVITDLRRNTLSGIGFHALASLSGLDTVTLTDGIRSVQNGFTKQELLNLVSGPEFSDFKWEITGTPTHLVLMGTRLN